MAPTTKRRPLGLPKTWWGILTGLAGILSVAFPFIAAFNIGPFLTFIYGPKICGEKRAHAFFEITPDNFVVTGGKLISAQPQSDLLIGQKVRLINSRVCTHTSCSKIEHVETKSAKVIHVESTEYGNQRVCVKWR